MKSKMNSFLSAAFCGELRSIRSVGNSSGSHSEREISMLSKSSSLLLSDKKRVFTDFIVRAAAGAVISAGMAVGVAPAFGGSVTISNGGLSMTFDLAWGAVITSIANSNVAGGVNIVDSHDVGRELQTDQFMRQDINGTNELMFNPTQAGAAGNQPYYLHPSGSQFTEVGSPVRSWSHTASSFHAVLVPRDYDTGYLTNWVYVEDVNINSSGIANVKYTCYDYQPETYTVNTEIPTLYSDLTDAFMYRTSSGTVQTVTGSPTYPQPVTSNGWIGNLDTTNNVGIFYTTPVGLPMTYGTIAGALVSDAPPLGKTNVVYKGITADPGTILSTQFSVGVGTQQNGPALISGQAPAVFGVSTSMIINGVFYHNAAAYTTSPGRSLVGANPAAPTGWTISGSGSGINGPDTGFYGSTAYQPFAPNDTGGVRDFNFLQSHGTFSAQTVATTTGSSYTLTFDAAQRSNDTGAVLEVIITDATGGSQIITLTPAINDLNFMPFFLNFTALSGSTNIKFLNNSPTGVDDTVDVSNVSLVDPPAVPEPASLGLFAIGGVAALVLLGRKRKAQA